MRIRAREGRRTLAGVAASRLRRETRRSRLEEIAASRAKAGATEEAKDAPGEVLARRDAAIARIEELAAEMERVIGAVEAMDTVIALFDPAHVKWNGGRRQTGADSGAGSRTPGPRKVATADWNESGFFGSDDRWAVVLSILREEEAAMTSAGIAAAYADRKRATLDMADRQRLVSRISAILNRLRKRCHVIDMTTGGHRRLWRLV